jgi:hypothetical protein
MVLHSLMSMGHLYATTCYRQVSPLSICLNRNFWIGFASGLKWLQMTFPGVPLPNLAINARRVRKVLIECGLYYTSILNLCKLKFLNLCRLRCRSYMAIRHVGRSDLLLLGLLKARRATAGPMHSAAFESKDHE